MIMSIKQAHAKWLLDGMDDIFTFTEYVKYLESTHISIIKQDEDDE